MNKNMTGSVIFTFCVTYLKVNNAYTGCGSLKQSKSLKLYPEVNLTENMNMKFHFCSDL